MAKQLNHKAADKQFGIALAESREVQPGTSRRALVLGLTTFSVAMAAQASQVANAKNHKQKFHQVNRRHKHQGRPSCYLEGTQILTPTGEVCIEYLDAGDMVLLHDGSARTIRRVVRKTICRAGNEPWDIRVAPIRFKQGSLADGVPHTDLYVSRAHCFLIDGYLVPAATLVNWESIVMAYDLPGSKLEYFHIELERHEIIVANGAPVETLLPGSEMDELDETAARAAWLKLEPYAPVLGLEGTGKKAASFARSIMAPMHDIRQPIDRIRDALHGRAVCNA